jgi:hypothetical protein
MAMKKNLFVFASAIVALMMSACVKDTTNDITASSGEEVTITASIEGMTRTSMEDFEAGGKADIVWSSGDKIGVVTESGTIRQATINAAAVGKVDAQFTVTGAVAGEKYIYGFYPFQSGVTYDKSTKTLKGVCLNNRRKFIKNQTAEEGSVLDGYGLTFETGEMHMVAKPDAKGNLVFKCSCGLIELQLTADKAINFYNFTLFSSSKELSDYGTVDMTAENPVFVPYNMAKYSWSAIDGKKYGTHSAYMGGSDNNGKGIQVNNTGVTKLFFVVPVGTYDDLEIQIGCPALCVTKKSTKPHTVKRNVILAFNPINVSQVSNLYTGSDVTDLSAKGCAFTYLVPTSASPKKYKFTAKMLGNTKEFKLPDGTLIENLGTSAYNYNTTYVYAEDTEGVITNLRREGDVVYFTASKPGNAIIVVGKSNLDRINQFHIWVSDAKDQTLPGGHVFLNCNLGATYVPETLAEAKAMTRDQIWRAAGCLYQWGNPTPRPSMTLDFVPANYTSSGNVDNANYLTKGWIVHPWSTDGYALRPFTSATNATDLKRTRNYSNFYSISQYTYTGSSVQSWWHASVATYGDMRFGAKALWQATKTQFDPCPPGYRVPSKKEIADAFTNDGTHTGKTYKIALGAAGQYYNYNSQFVFVSWSGLRRATDAVLFNPAFGSYPRSGFWFFDPDLSDEEDMLTTYSSDGCYMHYGTDKDNNEMYTKDKAIGKADVYPAAELRNSGTWNTTYQVDGATVKVPATNKMRYPVNTGMSIRCVRESNVAQPSSVAPSYNVDAATGF